MNAHHLVEPLVIVKVMPCQKSVSLFVYCYSHGDCRRFSAAPVCVTIYLTKTQPATTRQTLLSQMCGIIDHWYRYYQVTLRSRGLHKDRPSCNWRSWVDHKTQVSFKRFSRSVIVANITNVNVTTTYNAKDSWNLFNTSGMRCLKTLWALVARVG